MNEILMIFSLSIWNAKNAIVYGIFRINTTEQKQESDETVILS